MRHLIACAAVVMASVLTAFAAENKQIDVGAVITKADAEAALGEPVKDAQSRNEEASDGYYSRCNYYAQGDRKSLVLRVRQVKSAKLDAKQEFKMLSAGGKLRSLDNLGDRAGVATSAPPNGAPRTLMLYVAKGNALVTVGLGGMDDENMALQSAKALAKKILKQL
ncbi:MAG: hypothetical protein ACJ8KU_02090 [Chthoniobacterales bacterium]